VQFFLTQIVARIVAAYLAYDCLRTVRRALAEGNIRWFNSDLLNWSTTYANRRREPYQFWFQVGFQVFLMFVCAIVVLFGWIRPV
jgi:hypothetical protein